MPFQMLITLAILFVVWIGSLGVSKVFAYADRRTPCLARTIHETAMMIFLAPVFVIVIVAGGALVLWELISGHR